MSNLQPIVKVASILMQTAEEWVGSLVKTVRAVVNSTAKLDLKTGELINLCESLGMEFKADSSALNLQNLLAVYAVQHPTIQALRLRVDDWVAIKANAQASETRKNESKENLSALNRSVVGVQNYRIRKAEMAARALQSDTDKANAKAVHTAQRELVEDAKKAISSGVVPEDKPAVSLYAGVYALMLKASNTLTAEDYKTFLGMVRQTTFDLKQDKTPEVVVVVAA